MVNLDRIVWLHELGETEEARYRSLPMYAGRCLAGEAMINDMRIQASNYDDVEIIIRTRKTITRHKYNKYET